MARPDDPLGRRALFSDQPQSAPAGEADRDTAGAGTSPAGEADHGSAGSPPAASSAGSPPAGEPDRAAAGSPPTAAGDGRRALFSRPDLAGAADAATNAVPRPGIGSVVVRCGSCHQHTPVSLIALPRQLIPSMWWPLRRYPVLMRCPGCHRLSWCRIRWAPLVRP